MLNESIFSSSHSHFLHLHFLPLHMEQHRVSFPSLPIYVRPYRVVLEHALFAPEPNARELWGEMVDLCILIIKGIYSRFLVLHRRHPWPSLWWWPFMLHLRHIWKILGRSLCFILALSYISKRCFSLRASSMSEWHLLGRVHASLSIELRL